MVQDELKNANFDIIICDEGHRLVLLRRNNETLESTAN